MIVRPHRRRMVRSPIPIMRDGTSPRKERIYEILGERKGEAPHLCGGKPCQGAEEPGVEAEPSRSDSHHHRPPSSKAYGTG